MYWFILPLVFGFLSNLASAFTTTYSEKWGKETGTFITIILRDVIGIPVWALGFLLAIRSSSAMLYITALPSQIIGYVVISAGAVVIILALINIKAKAAAPSTVDCLVKTGIYSMVRHPIHSGTFLEFVGLFIVWPTLLIGISILLGFIWIYFQTRFEEMDLLRRIPGYKEYRINVPCYIPKIRRK